MRDTPELQAAIRRWRYCRRETPAGSYWRHLKSGDFFHITGHTMREATLGIEVAFLPIGFSEADMPSFTRPAAEFLDGRFVEATRREVYGDTCKP